MATKRRPRRVEFDYDPTPDFSWLEQDQYNPSKPGYDPVYPSKADMDRKQNAYDGDWYRDPENHVALCMLVYEQCNLGEWHVTDSLGNIDFLKDTDEWTIGTFDRLQALKAFPYLHELAKEAGLRR